MLRGLLIRKAFILVDLVLAAAVIGAAGLVAVGVLEEPVNPYANTYAKLEEPAALPEILRDVGDRGQYEGILKGRLFGPAGDDKPVAPAAPAPVAVPVAETPTEETDLRLVLYGTAATNPIDPLASAIIENQDNRQTHTYFLHDEILPEVTLDEVYARKVIITNKGKRQTLSMDDEEAKKLAAAQTGPAGDGPAPATAAPASSSAPAESGDRVSLDKQEFIQELYVNYADIVKKCKPEMYRDADGNVAGITASNISEIPLAKRLNLSDGDVLQTINNEKIDSQEKIIQLINKYRDTNTFRIGILRGGKPVMTTYSFK